MKRQIEEKRSKLAPILSTILFCATDDIALRRKTSDTGNLQDLFKLRVEADDEVLSQHMEKAAGNAKYTSVRTQNELIRICEDLVGEEIASAANASCRFSILADETADVSGEEQLSLGVRFVDTTNDKPVIREEFLGFTSLTQLDAETIVDT